MIFVRQSAAMNKKSQENKAVKRDRQKAAIKAAQAIVIPHQLQVTKSEFSGPLPPPSVLEHYNNIHPSAAKRIIIMAEKQAAHRQKLETKALDSGSRDSLLGLIFGLIIGLAAIGGGVLGMIKGAETGGGILSGLGLVSLVGVFVYGTRQRQKERQQKMG